MPTAVIRVTALTGFNLTPASPINPANSTVIETTTTITINAAQGLKISIDITINTDDAITQIARNKCHLQENKIKNMKN